MRITIAILINIFCFVNCFSQKAAADEFKFIISDESILKSDIVKSFVSIDSAGFGRPLLLNSKVTTVKLYRANFFILSIDLQIPYYIQPGEIIKISSKENRLILSVEGNSKRTNELNCFSTLAYRYGKFNNLIPDPELHRKVKSIAEIDQLRNQILNIKNKREDYLDSLIKTSSISDHFFQIAKHVIEASAISDIQILRWNNRAVLKKANVYQQLNYELFSEIKKMDFAPYVTDFKVNRTAITMLTTDYLDKAILDSIELESRVTFIKNNYAGKAKDYLLSYTLKSGLQNSIPISDNIMFDFLDNCSIEACKSIIQSILYKKKVSKVKGSNLLLGADRKTTVELLDVLKGVKAPLIVLDFWASWCAPCRASMPAVKKISKELENNRIQFLFISLDEDMIDWKNAHQAELLPNSTSFLLLKGFRAKMPVENKIDFIPRYILVNQSGQVINSNLPHPDDPAFKKVLLKYLNKN
ncbi:MAG: thioredoxin-like domain-containing protein [Sediminibacterium sp.]|nr:thioredoxin-like domain-containing protein [Sediminibacterium sp.]